MRMALSGHQFFWAFADTFGMVAAKEGAVIEEELQQALSRCQIWRVTNLLVRQTHAAATTSRHVCMADALKARCVLAEVR